MIYKVKDVYVISSHEIWLPGRYDTEKTARYAFRFTDEQLQNLQENLNKSQPLEKRIITYEMLKNSKQQKHDPK